MRLLQTHSINAFLAFDPSQELLDVYTASEIGSSSQDRQRIEVNFIFHWPRTDRPDQSGLQTQLNEQCSAQDKTRITNLSPFVRMDCYFGISSYNRILTKQKRRKLRSFTHKRADSALRLGLGLASDLFALPFHVFIFIFLSS